MSGLLTVPELAVALGISDRSVQRLAEQGRVPVYRLSQRTLRFRLDEVLAALRDDPKGGRP